MGIIPIEGRMNSERFLDLTFIAATGLNHPTEFFSTKRRSNLIYHSIPSGNVRSKACVYMR